MNQVHISFKAGHDLEEIEEYISRDNPEAAGRLIQRIEETCNLLAKNPEAGADRSELLPQLRGFPVGNYLIFYRPNDDGIDVARVLHGNRDIPNIFAENK